MIAEEIRQQFPHPQQGVWPERVVGGYCVGGAVVCGLTEPGKDLRLLPWSTRFPSPHRLAQVLQMVGALDGPRAACLATLIVEANIGEDFQVAWLLVRQALLLAGEISV